jgi:hypothetical protein
MSIFKVRDKVYHIEYGWGVVIKNDNGISFPILVEFASDLICSFTLDGRESTESKSSTLSFTEYTLQGFSQERPIELPEVGEMCLVRDNENEQWRVREFTFEHSGTFYVKSLCGSTDDYIYMKRFKILE